MNKLFEKKLFDENPDKVKVKKYMQEKNFDPLLITNKPGYIYEKHKHEETKMIICIEGSMEVSVGKKTFMFEPGDKLLIPGNTVHSAAVGAEGCSFFWAEKKI